MSDFLSDISGEAIGVAHDVEAEASAVVETADEEAARVRAAFETVIKYVEKIRDEASSDVAHFLAMLTLPVLESALRRFEETVEHHVGIKW